MCTPGGSFQILTGVEVADLSGIPDEFSGVRLPAQKYAVFSHREHVSTIRNTIGAIFDTWLPGSGYEAVSSPPFLERYGENFNPTTLMGDIEIWVPVKG
jgi:AraC family transcriptional regulator